MSVYKKLQHARRQLLAADIKKSGKNKFAGFEYFELADFLPSISCIFDDVGLCGVVRFHADRATLTIVDSEEPHTEIEFTTPLVYAENAKGQAIQSLGATHTYLRRYLWLMAMEIVEHDAVDASQPAEEERPKAKPPAKTPTKLASPDTPWAITVGPDANFVDSAVLGATKALDMAESTDDVVTIFKVNRGLFERLKEENKQTYDELMAIFSTRKTTLGEANG